ncbi:DUF3566 domain-containing protein [Auritidibacter sp. NML100628]|uniref:DUF3566 domain-containing protein n=1 Tax=Auritidibacter sp. NML100628 TaxID=2170742 RepID=UPI000D7348D3|nr:DUF3566 domain-containing protein [Auritidibacter sp. NML100628]PXA77053.1 hypothetical protein DCC24_05505 [Auritidibacter sp. NML100628]
MSQSSTPGPKNKPSGQPPQVRPQQAPPVSPGKKPAGQAQAPKKVAPAAQAGKKPGAGTNPAQGKKNTKGLVRPAPKAKVRRARLVLAKIDLWSVLKISFLLSVAFGVVTVVAGVVLWTVMDLTGIFDEVNALIGTILGTEGGGQTIQELVSLSQVASVSTIIAVVNVVLITLLSILAATIYNISASLVGGVGVTLTDD